MALEPVRRAAGFTAMPLLTDSDVAVLREACRAGELRIKVAGETSAAEREREFERCKSATVLAHLGFLHALPDQGAYARWRPVAGCKAALAAVEAERRS